MLRRLPTSRLLMLCALAAVVAVTIGAAAAGAFGGSGPVPPPKPLPVAVHNALAAPEVAGVTATIDFTNKLIDTSGIRGASPLLSGASGRLWATRDRLRLELQAPAGAEGAGDVQVLVDRNSFSVLDVGTNTLYRGTLPADASRPHARHHEAVPSVAKIESYIKRVAQHLSLAGPTPSDVGGRPAYGLTLSPKRNAGLIGGVRIAWDAGKGLPLSVAVYARGASSPTLSLRATHISFGPVAASTFALSPPPHAKVVDVSPPTERRRAHATRKPATGVSAVQAALPFKLSAPSTLAGHGRGDVTALGRDGAAVRYGQGLGGILVIERKANPKASRTLTLPSSGRHSDAQLPTVAVPGATASEIATPLGTLIHFTRGGVDYTVVGSVTKATAESAARAL